MEQINVINSKNKAAKYESLLPQINALVSGEEDLYANLANIVAALKEAMGFFWVGFYLVKHEDLVLGPFQGPVACTRIGRGKGVCGTAWLKQKAMVVPDVDVFPGHISCNSKSKSEIVIPVIKNGKVIMVLDIDSETLDDFDEIDTRYLQQLAHLVGKLSE